MVRMIQNHVQQRGLLAIPNHRSSHSEPTPTSGGWAFAFIGLSSAIGSVYYYQLSHEIIWFFVLPLAVVSALGGFDDVHQLSPKFRLLVQVICSAMVLSGLYLANSELSQSLLLLPVSALLAGGFLVWFVNLYNFMDGIDGIATVEAITVVLSWLLTLGFAGHSLSAPELLAVTVFLGSLVGFLLRNWSPAGIFMGDVGSNYIGFGLATTWLYLVAQQPDLWMAYLIPLSVFWVDATFTLLCRIMTGQEFLHAHRSHTYQILSRRWQSHSKVVVVMGVYNICWLLPLALLATSGLIAGLLALLAAWLPVVILAWRSRAGLVNGY